MSFQAFMNKARRERKNHQEDFKVSDVFEENFKLKTISFSTLSALREKHSKLEFIINEKQEKMPVKRTNEGTLALDICTKAIVHPNLKDAELQNFYQVMDEISLVEAMLTTSEISTIADKVLKMSGHSESINDVKEKAKN